MVKAVIFDMFETLVTLFTEHTYFGEDAASDAGVDPVLYRKVWHENEKDRTTGRMTIEEGIGETLRKLDVYSDELLNTIVSKRLAALQETFDQIPDESVQLLLELRRRGIKVGLITNTFSDERDLIRSSKLFPLFDATRISYEEGVLKPDPSMYQSIMIELGVTPDECLYVGDGGSRELSAAATSV